MKIFKHSFITLIAFSLMFFSGICYPLDIIAECIAPDCTTVDSTEYTMITGYSNRYSWEGGNYDTVSYRWELYSVERDFIELSGNTTNTEVYIAVPKVGHYILRVYEILSDSSEIEHDSMNDGKVNGVVRSWRIYGFLEGPGPIIVE